MDEMKNRLLQFIERKNITVAEFEKSASLGNGIISKPSKLSKKSIDKICAAYAEINREWLETGEGEMENPPKSQPKSVSILYSPGSAASLNGNAIVHPIDEHDELIKLREEVRLLRQFIADKDALITELQKMNDFLMNLKN